MPQQSTSGSSLTVLGGPLDRTSVAFDYGSAQVLIGSGQECGLRLPLPGVSPVHARLVVDGTTVSVHEVQCPQGIYVNDTRVSAAALRDGDIVWLGPPGEPDSVMLRCSLASADPNALHAPPAVAAAPAPEAPAAGMDAFFVEESFDTAPPPPPVPPPAAPVDDFFVADTPSTPHEPAHPPAPPPPAPAPPRPAPPAPVAAAPPAPAPRPPQPAPPAQPPRPPAVPAAAPPQPATGPAQRPPAAPAAGAPPATAPRPPAARPAPGPGAAARPPVRRAGPPVRPAARPVARRSSSGPLFAFLGVLAVAALAGGGFLFWRSRTAPGLESVSPQRVRAGQTVTLSGAHFGTRAQDNAVLFGDQPGSVLTASDGRLEVSVPDLQMAPGAEARVGVSVQVGSRRTAAVTITVYQGPRLHGLSPDVAMPGELVELSGAGWAEGAVVRFGEQPARIVESHPDKLRVRVPELQGPPGTSMPVTVTQGEAVSNPGPFFLGRLPLLLKVEPARAAPGDVVTVSGRGFRPEHWAMSAALADRRALVLQASETELQLVVPRAPGGATVIRVAINPTSQVSEMPFEVAPPADPIDLRFVAEPLEEDPSGEHVVLATDLGPAFVLSSSGGKPAPARALEAQRRLNAAAVVLKASLDAELEARNFSTDKPVLALKGKPEALIEVSREDAAAYNKDWSRLGARAKPVTPGRLATWWGAVAQDLVLLLVRNEKPVHSAGLAPEGRVLQDVYTAAHKETHYGVPRKLLDEARPGLVQALRTLALRVPPGVNEPVDSPTAALQGAPPPRPFKLEGEWLGSETVPEGKRALRVEFRATTGTLYYESGFSVGLPLASLSQPQKGSVHFSVGVRGGIRHYQGRYDGQKLTGTISDEERGTGVGTFELVPR